MLHSIIPESTSGINADGGGGNCVSICSTHDSWLIFMRRKGLSVYIFFSAFDLNMQGHAISIDPICLSGSCLHECTINGFTVAVQGSEIISRFTDIPSHLDKHFSDKFISYKASALKISPMCLESDPCQQDSVITYQDGSRVNKTMSGRTIVDSFMHLLNDNGKQHFSYLIKSSGCFTIH